MTLSKDQKEIVNCTASNIIVDAGSGSGKTRTLTERVRRILKSGVNPKSVVVITFTNLAADELSNRLKDVKNADQCFIGTIHSYANFILKKSGKFFEIYDDEFEQKFMAILIPKYARYCTLEDYKLLKKLRSLCKIGKVSQSDIPYKFTDVKVYKELTYLLGEESSYLYTETVKTLCEANNVLTFDELIKHSIDYFNESKIVLEHLFVDELQDIGYLEYDFLMKLNSKNNFFIGDDYQAIYGFKGGDVNIFLSLMKNPEWKSFYLVENYRTCEKILAYASMIIHKASNIIDKPYVCMNKEQGELSFQAKSQLASFIGKLDKQENWMFLTRTNKELIALQAQLKNMNVDFYCVNQVLESEEARKKAMSKSKITLMTVHKSKGLECDNVALYGKFPIKDTKDEDEYKVFYVGVTRAKTKCCIFV